MERRPLEVVDADTLLNTPLKKTRFVVEGPCSSLDHAEHRAICARSTQIVKAERRNE